MLIYVCIYIYNYIVELIAYRNAVYLLKSTQGRWVGTKLYISGEMIPGGTLNAQGKEWGELKWQVGRLIYKLQKYTLGVFLLSSLIFKRYKIIQCCNYTNVSYGL